MLPVEAVAGRPSILCFGLIAFLAMSASTLSQWVDSHVPHAQRNACIGRKPCVAWTGLARGHGGVGDELEDGAAGPDQIGVDIHFIHSDAVGIPVEREPREETPV
jgi:hypothetical protein